MTDYFDEGLADGLSGDDINRRRREKALGHCAPSADWADCGKEIRCIYPGQVPTRPAIGKGIHFYCAPAVFAPKTDTVFILAEVYDASGRGIENGYPDFVPQMSINPERWRR